MMKRELVVCHLRNTRSNLLGKVVVQSKLVALENRPLNTFVSPQAFDGFEVVCWQWLVR